MAQMLPTRAPPVDVHILPDIAPRLGGYLDHLDKKYWAICFQKAHRCRQLL